MNDRLYYTDAYTTRFAAHVIERVQQEDRFAVVLDRTFFYPTSGGQPSDRGQINNVPVIDVSIRESDDAILHWLAAGPVEGDEVTAEIDWSRRFDHMQQHSGQHILSQAFLRTGAAETISFHLGNEAATIDLDRLLTYDQVEQAEALANEIVWENRPVHVRLVTPEEAPHLALRKAPPGRNGALRLIDIEAFDLSACGGTHVANTGGVGLIKVVKSERRGKELRVEFRCGRRAWRHGLAYPTGAAISGDGDRRRQRCHCPGRRYSRQRGARSASCGPGRTSLAQTGNVTA